MSATMHEGFAGRTTIRGFPSPCETDCFYCDVPIRVGDLALRSNNLFEDEERGIFKEGPSYLHAYHAVPAPSPTTSDEQK